MLQVEADGEVIQGSPFALNDIAVLKRDEASMITVRMASSQLKYRLKRLPRRLQKRLPRHLLKSLLPSLRVKKALKTRRDCAIF